MNYLYHPLGNRALTCSTYIDGNATKAIVHLSSIAKAPIFNMVEGIVTKVDNNSVIITTSKLNFKQDIDITYSNLSIITVKQGNNINRKDIIGNANLDGVIQITFKKNNTDVIIDKNKTKFKNTETPQIKDKYGHLYPVSFSGDLLYYVTSIFSQSVTTLTGTYRTIENAELIAAMMCQEDSFTWGSNETIDLDGSETDSQLNIYRADVAKVEGICRVARNRKYKINGNYLSIMRDLQPSSGIEKSEDVEKFRAQLNKKVCFTDWYGKRYTDMTYLTFVSNILSGADYFLPEKYLKEKKSFIIDYGRSYDDIYAMTAYPDESAIAVKYRVIKIKDLNFGDWRLYPSNSAKTVNQYPLKSPIS